MRAWGLGVRVKGQRLRQASSQIKGRSKAAKRFKIAIVASRFNPEVCNGLVEGAVCALKEAGFSEKDLLEEMDQLKVEIFGTRDETNLPKRGILEPSQDASIELPPKNTRRGMIAENLMSLAISKNDITALLPQRQYFPAWHKQAYDELREPKAEAGSTLSTFINTLTLKAGAGLAHDETTLIKELRREYLKERQDELKQKIALAEKVGDETALVELVKEIDLLTNELHNEPQ